MKKASGDLSKEIGVALKQSRDKQFGVLRRSPKSRNLLALLKVHTPAKVRRCPSMPAKMSPEEPAKQMIGAARGMSSTSEVDSGNSLVTKQDNEAGAEM
jgi:hypothetical protein